MNSLTSQILVNVIKQAMKLPDTAVWIRDQNRLIPNDNGLYVIVGMINSQTTANATRMETKIVDGQPVEHEINEVQQSENIQIDILSRSNDALTRNWEIIAAIQGFYGQQQQERNNFKIFRIPRGFLNTSGAEGGSQLNRYSITISCAVWYRKDSILDSPLGDYYDDFKTRVDDYITIGTDNPLIEFEIDQNTPPPP